MYGFIHVGLKFEDVHTSGCGFQTRSGREEGDPRVAMAVAVSRIIVMVFFYSSGLPFWLSALCSPTLFERSHQAKT